jgi:CheY-like chemotaxis protein
MHILICEDENFIRQTLAEYLTSLGYKVSEAENGLECINFVSHTLPDLILVDLKMPVMDGYTAIAKLKERNIKVPIIILSGFTASDHPILQEYESIQKPYKLSQISDLIKKKLSKSSASALG